jgi:hypothetical protein
MRFILVLISALFQFSEANANYYDSLVATYGADAYFPFASNGNATIGAYTYYCQTASGSVSCSYGNTIAPNVTGQIITQASNIGISCIWNDQTNCQYGAASPGWITNDTSGPGASGIFWIKGLTSGAQLIWGAFPNIIEVSLFIEIGDTGCGATYAQFKLATYSTSLQHVCSSAPVQDGSPHMLGYSCTSPLTTSTCTLYVDGVALGSTIPLPNWTMIGSPLANVDCCGRPIQYIGAIGGVAHFPTPLTAPQMLALWNAGFGGSVPGGGPMLVTPW